MKQFKNFLKEHDMIISTVAAILIVVCLYVSMALGVSFDLPAWLVGGCLCAVPILFFLSLLPCLFE